MTDTTAGSPPSSTPPPTSQIDQDNEPIPPPKNPWGWFRFWAAVTISYALICYIAWEQRTSEFVLLNTQWNPGLTLVLGLVLYTLASLRIVGPTNLGAILRFGKPILQVWPGLKFVPLVICQLVTETRNIIQNELPAEPEKIYRLKDGESAIPTELGDQGFREPTRITFADAEEVQRGDDLLQRRVTAEVPIVVRWKIINYLTFIGAIGSRGEAVRQMEDAAIAMATQELPKFTVGHVLANIEVFNAKIKGAIEARIQEKSLHHGWGIDFKSSQIKLVGFGHKLNLAIQAVPEARAAANVTVLAADARRIELTREGEGRGAGERAELGGRTEGLKNMANELGVDAAAVLGAETARAITANPNQTIVVGTGGFADLVGIAATVGKSFKPKDGGQPSPEPQGR